MNLSPGEYEWQIPLGNDESRQGGKAGPITTVGGLLFISGTEDKKLRALNKTGKLFWQTRLPALANATYMVNGKQFVTLAVGATKDNPSGSVMAFALP